jgi:hypothetical protein
MVNPRTVTLVQRLMVSGPRRLGANHLDAIGNDLHVSQVLQHQVLTVMGRYAITASRHNDPFSSRLQFCVDESLEVKRHGRGQTVGDRGHAANQPAETRKGHCSISPPRVEVYGRHGFRICNETSFPITVHAAMIAACRRSLHVIS